MPPLIPIITVLEIKGLGDSKHIVSEFSVEFKIIVIATVDKRKIRSGSVISKFVLIIFYRFLLILVVENLTTDYFSNN